jgi:hypothetical protein
MWESVNFCSRQRRRRTERCRVKLYQSYNPRTTIPNTIMPRTVHSQNGPYLEWTIPRATNPRMTIPRTDHT